MATVYSFHDLATEAWIIVIRIREAEQNWEQLGRSRSTDGVELVRPIDRTEGVGARTLEGTNINREAS